MLTEMPTDRLVFQSRLYLPDYHDYAHAYINNYDFKNLQYACFSDNNNVKHYQTFIITSKLNITK